MRARNIKPGFFTNEVLGTLDPIICMLFLGLWCLADRHGILEDRPLRIKAELFPYRENLDMHGYLTVLQRCQLIIRYEVDGVPYIKVTNFEKHQSPHHTEKSKGYPPPPLNNGYDTVTSPLDNGEHQVPQRSDSLIHGFTDSLIPVDGNTASCISENKKNSDVEVSTVTASGALQKDLHPDELNRGPGLKPLGPSLGKILQRLEARRVADKNAQQGTLPGAGDDENPREGVAL